MNDVAAAMRDWVVLGRVSGLFGVNGWVRVFSHTEPRAGMTTILAGFDLGTVLLAGRARTATRGPTLLAPVLMLSALPVLAAGAVPDALPSWLVYAAAAGSYLLAALMTRDAATTPFLRVAPWAGAIGTVFAASAVTVDSTGAWRLTALAALAVAYAATVRALGPRAHLWQAAAALFLTLGAVGAAAPLVAQLAARATAVSGIFLPDLVTLAGTAAAVIVLWPALRQYAALLAPASSRYVPWVGGALALLYVGSAVVAGGVVLGRRAEAAAGGFVAGHGLATLLLAVVAAYLLMHGLRGTADAGVALRAGLALAGCAVLKLLFFDLPTLDGIVRIVAFIGAGLALLAMGTGYAKALDRARAA